ncbi:hypothetical protein GOV11_02265 [Candidatus Woesearchaeota archaeon]|nr:hypothetical protein [Candidatus Woesearchaeota archaeon]
MASYLGRNVNLALLLIIIGVVVALVGTTVFFQQTLENKTTSFESTSETLTACQVALTNYQDRYSESQERVSETAEDIRKYDELYEQKVGELGDTQQQLLQAKTQQEFERLQKQKFQERYETELATNRELSNNIDDLKGDILSLRSDISDLEDELDACT